MTLLLDYHHIVNKDKKLKILGDLCIEVYTHLGGLNFDMALASTFISTTAAFLECTKEEKCSKQKKI